MPRFRLPAAAAGAAALTLVLSACTQPAASDGQDGSGDGRIQVVASTNIYGDIAGAIGGDAVEVTPIISRISQDPHSYEATAQDKLALSKADLVIENGGGYDSFMHVLIDDLGIDHANVVTAVEVAGLDLEAQHSGDEAGEPGAHAGHDHAVNEHVWYDLAAVSDIADDIAGKLGRLDSAQADTFAANAEQFTSRLDGLQATLDEVAARAPGTSVGATDPVAGYLLEAAGLENATPPEFAQAVEEESDAPPLALQEMQDLVRSKSIAFLAYNEQTEGPQAESIRAIAEEAGVPVLNFTETLPDGMAFVEWMTGNVEAIDATLGSR
jgi:zinc/manganese transport system substrate-binding protein